MRVLLLTVLCTYVFTQIESYYITIDYIAVSNTSIMSASESVSYWHDDLNYNVENFTVGIAFGVDKENDFPLKYYYDVDGTVKDNGVTSLCQADLGTYNGTIASIVSKAMGIPNDPPCPLEDGNKTFHQLSVFKVDGGTFDDLLNDETNAITLSVSFNNMLRMKLLITKDAAWAEPGDDEDPDEGSTALNVKDAIQTETGDEQ